MISSAETAPFDRLPGQTSKARKLRSNETEAEYRLWCELKNRLLNGYKFTRQIPLGPYVADFVCRSEHLVVELDGSQHAYSAHDEKRTRWLNENGYSVLRFWNHEVLQERRSVLETILAALTGELSLRCETVRFFPKARKRAPWITAFPFFAPLIRPSATFSPLGRRGSTPATFCSKLFAPRNQDAAGIPLLPDGEKAAEGRMRAH